MKKRERTVLCSYCDGRARLTTGAELYPGRPDLSGKLFWFCAPCRAWVGCHAAAKPNGKGGQGDGTVPLGRLADRALRRAKQAAHDAFDPLWRSGEMSRQGAYAWLAGALRIPNRACHIGGFDLEQCQAVIAACAARRATATSDEGGA